MEVPPTYRWGVTYLYFSGRLTGEERYYVMQQATKLYLDDEEERQLKTEGLEGKLTTMRTYEVLGNYGGQRFDAVVETKNGKARLRFLVCEMTGRKQGAAEMLN